MPGAFRWPQEVRDWMTDLAAAGHSIAEINAITWVNPSTVAYHCGAIIQARATQARIRRAARNRERRRAARLRAIRKAEVAARKQVDHQTARAREIAALRTMVAQGRSLHATAKLTGRSKTMVRTHCGDLRPPKGEPRCLEVLRIVESSRLPRATLAHDLGYANEASLAVVLCRARKIRAQFT